MKLRIGWVVVGFLLSVLSLAAQTVNSVSASSLVPPLIQFSNVATDQGGNSLSGVVSITFSLYAAQRGGEPLWSETQTNIQLDPTGHYSVQLGITKPSGVPTALFTTGEARWLEVQVGGQAEQPRVLLVSVPYALKAGDAATIGGLPPSAFVLAAPQSGAASAYAAEAVAEPTAPPPAGTDVTTIGGTANYLPLFNGTTTVIDSVVFQSATSPFKIGINTATPASTLDIKGGSTVRGLLSLPAAGTATSTKAYNSQPLKLTASAFNTGTGTAVAQNFQWQAEPLGNDSPSTSGAMSLLYATGSNTPAETGLKIASNGAVAATSFSGSGSGLTDVTASNSSELGGLAASAYAQLAAANTFSGNQSVNGTVTATSFSGNGAELTNVTAANSNELGGLAPTSYATTGSNAFTGNQAVSGTISGAGPCCTGGISSSGGVTGSGLYGIQGATYGPDNKEYGWGVSGYVPSGITNWSAEGLAFAESSSAGVWGDDGNSVDGSGVLATADSNTALIAVNNSGNPSMEVYNYTTATHNPVFETYSPNTYSNSRNCTIDTSANLTCTGVVMGVVGVDGGRAQRAMYAVQSPENWFEDFGSGTLNNGSAHISLEAMFGEAVNSGVDYHVFLTPKGDCEGLYVANEGAEGFDVRELRQGKSSIAFDYRIVAKRRGYETVRMEDLTPQADARKARMEALARRMAEAAARPATGPAPRMLRSQPSAPPATTPQMGAGQKPAVPRN